MNCTKTILLTPLLTVMLASCQHPVAQRQAPATTPEPPPEPVAAFGLPISLVARRTGESCYTTVMAHLQSEPAVTLRQAAGISLQGIRARPLGGGYCVDDDKGIYEKLRVAGKVVTIYVYSAPGGGHRLTMSAAELVDHRRRLFHGCTTER